jgi:hypothetical protein
MEQLKAVTQKLTTSCEQLVNFLEVLSTVINTDNPNGEDYDSIHSDCEQIYRELQEILFFLNGIWNCKTLDEIRIKANKED